MIKIETYQPIEEKGDLREIAAKKIGPTGKDIIYLGETLKKEEHIYHMNNVTVFVGKSYISFVGSSEERQKTRETLEQRLSVKLKIFKNQIEESILR